MTARRSRVMASASFGVVLALATAASSAPYRIPKDRPTEVPGEIVVKFRDMGPGKNFSARVAGEVAQSVNATVISSIPRLGIQRLRVPPEKVRPVLSKLREDKTRVERAEPNRYIYATERIPDDLRWKEQWNLPKIGMPKAWDRIAEVKVLVAVVDTGIDYEHPELKANIWTNTRKGVVKDDKGNPLNDHDHGISFCDDGKPGDPIDLLGHGTQVAGVIGAHGNNRADVAGVAWRVELMAVKVLCKLEAEVPTGTVADAIAGIDYAIQQGAAILNLSWGFYAKDGNLEETLKGAGLVIASAGNENGNNDNEKERVYPAGFDLASMIAVAGTTQSDGLAPLSNYGEKTVHLAAPGTAILTTTLQKSLKIVEGTSFAAPHVTGCAALLRGLVGPNKSLFIKGLLLDKADQVSGLKVNKGRRLNCGQAVQSLP